MAGRARAMRGLEEIEKEFGKDTGPAIDPRATCAIIGTLISAKMQRSKTRFRF
jgi:hypothetical protein